MRTYLDDIVEAGKRLCQPNVHDVHQQNVSTFQAAVMLDPLAICIDLMFAFITFRSLRPIIEREEKPGHYTIVIRVPTLTVEVAGCNRYDAEIQAIRKVSEILQKGINLGP